MNMGGFAQYMAAPEIACAKLPASLSLADAALVEPLAVGMLGVQINPFPIGSKVVVLGSGPIGLAAAFWARRAGAGRVVSVARSQQREPLALAIGADAFFVTSDTLGEELRSYLGGPADTVIECAGVPGSIQRAVEIVKPRGSVTVLGLCTHSDPWVPALALTKEIRIQFAVGTTIRQFEDVADFLSAGHLEASAMVTDTVSLDALPDAFEALRNRTTQCKVMVDPWAGL
jgi:(R,R)-butanediol dehydrogenase/meso-butanediol dehydrogenase/diacetyl reductase